MVEANKFKLGLFVITAVILGIVVLFVLGFAEIFKDKIHFMTVFDESVQGLDVGAPVKYRGVSIGKVNRIAIIPSRKGKDNMVKVNMVALPTAVDPDAAAYSGSQDAKEEFFHEFFTKEVNNGLRCRIDSAGITGVKYIEIDYFADGDKSKISYNPPPGISYLPSTPSLFKELSKNLSQALIKISSIDFKKISSEVQNTLTTVNRHMNDPKIANMIDRLDKISSNFEQTSKNINQSLTKEKIQAIVKQFETSLKSFDQLTTDIRNKLEAAQIEKTGADVRATLKAAVQLRNEISVTLDSVTELVNSLDEDPSAIIRGKQQPAFPFKNDK